MTLKRFWDSLEPPARRALATAAGTTYGHLRNVVYGYRPCDPILAVALERESQSAVRRWHARPSDWHAIWPELVNADGAPPVLEPAEARE